MTPEREAEIARIAGGLTKAQRRAVLGERTLDGPGMWPLRNGLKGLGLTEGIGGATWTPLGLAVRAISPAPESTEKAG